MPSNDPALAAYKCECPDQESAVSPAAYLADLLEYAASNLNDHQDSITPSGRSRPSIDDLEGAFYQPFGELVKTPAATDERVRHVRLTVEVLLGYIEDRANAGVPTPSETTAYREAAYDALLEAWGLTREDLRDATYNGDDRAAVAETLGVPTGKVTVLHLDSDAPLGPEYDDPATSGPYAPTEANLEDLFGLPAMTTDASGSWTRTDPMRSPGEPAIHRWRDQYLSDNWWASDYPEDPYPVALRSSTPYSARVGGATEERPVVDPDVIGPADMRVIPASVSSMPATREGAVPDDDSVYTLWEDRRRWLDADLAALRRLTPVVEGDGPIVVADVKESGSTLNEEQVVIENVGSEPRDLDGWQIEDLDGNSYTLPSFTLGDGDSVTIHSGSGSQGASDLYWDADSQVWDDNRDTCFLYDEDGSLVDKHVYPDGADVVTLCNRMLDGVEYDGSTHAQAWYEAMSSDPTAVPRQPSGSADDPLAVRGFLSDFALLERQLAAEGDAAVQARSMRAGTPFPTGSADASPGEAAREVVETHLRLGERALERLVELLRTHFSSDGSLDDGEWWELVSILGGARKRAVYDAWITEEAPNNEDVHLDRKPFWQSLRQPTTGDWSFRLDRHDPPGTAESEPFVDPARDARGDLAERPRGATAHELYTQRQQALQRKRATYREVIEDRRKKLQAAFESFVQRHDDELQRLAGQVPDGGPVPGQIAKQSPIDPALDDRYASVSWPNAAGSDREGHFEWLHTGLELAEQDPSTLSASEQQHAADATAKLDDLSLSRREFRRLHTLRERSKLTEPDEGGLTSSKLATTFSVLPTGNPLDPVLTKVYDAKSADPELSSVLGSAPHRWDALFDDIHQALESDGGARPPALEALELSIEEFETLLSLRRRARPGPDGEPPPEPLVTEAVELLTATWKHIEKYDESRPNDWISEEKTRGVTDYWDAYQARLPRWRTRGERADWQRALALRNTAPIVDPDLLVGDDFETPGTKQPGYDLWTDRTNALSGSASALVADIQALRNTASNPNASVNPSDARTKLDEALRRIVGVSLSELRGISEALADGEERGGRLTRLDLSPSALSFLLTVADRLGNRPVRATEWASIENILLGVWKQRQYGRWTREERAHEVVLSPDQFDLPDEDDAREPPGDDDPLRWRINWTVREEWIETLETRTDQQDAVEEEVAEAVAAAERAALPILRESLIDRIDEPSASADAAASAEWLSERLLVDIEMHADRETTRVSQATTSLQELLQSLDLSLDEGGGLADLGLVLDDDSFDERWQWLGTYPKWKAAMGVYLYPQNVVLPTLRRRTTETFDRLASRLSGANDLSSADVRAAVDEYGDYVEDVLSLEPVAGAMGPGPTSMGWFGDDPKGVAYVIARSRTSGDYYFSTFDPAVSTSGGPAIPETIGEPWPDNSTWQRIPDRVVGSFEEVEGAATYEGELYVFATATPGGSGDGGDGEDGGGGDGSGGGGGSAGSDSGVASAVKYARYDLREDVWRPPETVALPDDRGYQGFMIKFTDESEVAGVNVVVREGWDAPPEIVVDVEGKLVGQGSDGSQIERWGYYVEYFVQFADDGTPPDPKSYAPGGHVTPFMKATPTEVVHLRDEFRLAFTPHKVEYIELLDGPGEFSINEWNYLPNDIRTATEVVYRPGKNEVVLIDGDVDRGAVVSYRVNPWNDALVRKTEESGPLQSEGYVSKLDSHLERGLVPCNNTIPLPGRALDEGDEVLLARGITDWTEGEDEPANKLVVGASIDVTLRVTVAVTPPLCPAMLPPSDGTHRWRLGPDPEDVDPNLESTASAHRSHAETITSETWTRQKIYVEEAYYHLPLLIAKQLTRVGEYETALEWFRTFYDYTRDSANKRAVWPELGTPHRALQYEDPRPDWLLDPINPHDIALTREDPHLQFTLFSLIRCYLEYGDQEFAQDTPESVANATNLYEHAIDLLERDVLDRDPDPCESELRSLEAEFETHVLGPSVWSSDPDLTEAAVERLVAEAVETVGTIDDYTTRRDAVDAVASVLEAETPEALREALDVAEQWAEGDVAQTEGGGGSTSVRSVSEWWSDFGSQLLMDPRVERSLADLAAGLNQYLPATTDDSDEESTGEESNGQEADEDYTHLMMAESTDSGPVMPEWIEVADDHSSAVPNIDLVGLVDDGFTTAGESDDGDVDGGDAPVADGGDVASVADQATMSIIEGTTHRFCVPENPLLASLRRHAETNLEKIRSGRNIAGIKRELAAYTADIGVESATPTPGGGVARSVGAAQPTDYRYETLIDRAKTLADRAQEFESEFLTAIEGATSEERKLRRARQQVSLAEERVSLQETRMRRAKDRVELAKRKRQRARIRKDTYANWRDDPLVEMEKNAIGSLQMAQMYHDLAAFSHQMASYLHMASAILSGAASGGYFGTGKVGAGFGALASSSSSIAAMTSSVAAADTARASSFSTQAQIQQIKARKQRRKRRWKLKEQVAQQNYKIGTQRITVARDTVDIVSQEREIAELRAEHAKDLVNFHENKFTSQELYQWIVEVLEGIYRYFLQQAAAVARLAQRQLAFERQELPKRFIKNDYWSPPTDDQTALPSTGEDGRTTDRRGLTGSARLLQDIYELDQFEFSSDQRRLEAETTFSLSELDPMELQQFRETGVLSFSTSLEDVQWEHPGHYHRLIKDVDVSIVALTPPIEGINATLRNSGTSTVVVGDTLFQERTIKREPEAIVLDRAIGEPDRKRVRLQPGEEEMLRPFENSGVATDWELRMPKASNDMDYDTIVDVQLSVTYTALSSYQYREQVLSELDEERTVERSFSFHDEFGDAWYDLVESEAGASTTVVFETERDDFPANLADVSIESVELYLVGPTSDEAREALKDLQVTLSRVDGGKKQSRATNGVVDTGGAFAGADVEGSWELTVTPVDTPDPFADGTIEDVLAIVRAEGTAPGWPP